MDVKITFILQWVKWGKELLGHLDDSLLHRGLFSIELSGAVVPNLFETVIFVKLYIHPADP